MVLRGNAKGIFIGPQEIAGYYSNLAKGFREIGIDCDYITYTPHPFGYGGETSKPLLLRLVQFFNRFRVKSNKNFIINVIISLPGEILSSIWAILAIFKYDVFIFSFGKSLLRGRIDLLLLRILKKRAFVVYHGSDGRPPFSDGFVHHPKDEMMRLSLRRLQRRTKLIFRNLHSFERAGITVIGNPFSTYQYANFKFINFLTLGLPISLENDFKYNDIKIIKDSSIIRILHSPSHPVSKGSAIIKLAVMRLKSKGLEVNFIELSNKSHSEVVEEIKKCDFVIDQVFSDFPLAGFATEAAWFGKPAVVGGYGFDYLKTLIPDDMWPPSKTCHPDRIEQAIEDLIVNPGERLRLGAKAQKFVREKWNAAEVARRYLRLIEGDIPEDWWLDPNTVTYLEGCGQPIERTKENIRQMVEKFGVESLQLRHRPDLERAFLEFADVKPASPHA